MQLYNYMCMYICYAEPQAALPTEELSREVWPPHGEAEAAFEAGAAEPHAAPCQS